MNVTFRFALKSDAEEISRLVNCAYRPKLNNHGWTHEAELISGDRINAKQVEKLLCPQSLILVACLSEKIIACVHIENSADHVYIGMLACEPNYQGQGIGKEMLFQAEQYSLIHFKSKSFKMKILSSRPELFDFYQRRGYKLSGEFEEFYSNEGVGFALVTGLKILGLEKNIQNHERMPI